MKPMMMSGSYNYWLVALSFGIAVLTSYTAIGLVERVTACEDSQRCAWLGGGAISMGTGIWCMHYIGMLAFHLAIPIRYHWPTVAVSLLAAILASLIALFVVSRPKMKWSSVLIGSVLMGSGIAGMHYIGMAAMRMAATRVYHVGIVGASVVLAVAISYAGLTVLFYMRRGNRGSWLKLVVALLLGMSIAVMHYTGMAAITFHASASPIDYAHSITVSTLANFMIFRLAMLFLGIAAITSVVDRRMSAQSKLLNNERKMLRALIDHIPDLMYVKDIEGRFVLANLRLARLVGAGDPRTMIGRCDFDYFPFEFAARFREDELRVMTSGEALIEHEEAGVDIKGNTFPMLTTKVPLRDSSGRVSGIAGVGRDVTALKKGEAALKAAEQKYRAMYNEALVGICSVDRDFHLVPG